jgi:hypothetical protein
LSPGGTALAAAVNVTTLAAAEPDPIFAVIERHRDLSAHCSAAYAISGNLHAGPEFDAAEAVSTERHDLVIDQANAPHLRRADDDGWGAGDDAVRCRLARLATTNG